MNHRSPGRHGVQGTGTPSITEESRYSTSLVGAVEPDARLSLKPTESTSGYVDGAWWPRSSDLVAQIPALVAELADRWGAVDRVSYDIEAWAPAARRVTAGGRQIRLDGFRGRRPSDAVHVMAAYRPVRTLLVVPPTTEPHRAAETLRRAGTSGNQETIGDLLAQAQSDDSDLNRWDTEGGHDRGNAR